MKEINIVITRITYKLRTAYTVKDYECVKAFADAENAMAYANTAKAYKDAFTEIDEICRAWDEEIIEWFLPQDSHAVCHIVTEA